METYITKAKDMRTYDLMMTGYEAMLNQLRNNEK